MKTSRYFLIFAVMILLGGCAVGPTPERIGFDYPEAGIKFSPRRHVVSSPLGETVPHDVDLPYTLIFPRTSSKVENPDNRLLFTGISGEWDYDERPLFDEISHEMFGADETYEFEMVEKREITLDWNGVIDPIGTYRLFRMVPVGEEDGGYTFTVTVIHFGNTIEVCWRDTTTSPPDDAKLERFNHWTHGLKFSEPEVPAG